MPSALIEWYPELPAYSAPAEDLTGDADRRLAALTRSILRGHPCSCVEHQPDAA